MKTAWLLALVLLAGAVQALDMPISTPPPGPSPNGVRGQSVVALGDGFLVLWIEGSECTDETLRGTRVDRDGHVRDARSFAVSDRAALITIVGAASDRHAAYVSWQSAEGYGHPLHLTRIESDATVTELSGDIPITGQPVTMRMSHGYFMFLNRGGTNGSVTATLADENGRIIQRGLQLLDPSTVVTAIDLAATEDSFLLGWITKEGTISVANLSLADLIAARVPPLTPAVLGQSLPMPFVFIPFLRLVSDGEHAAALWRDDTALRLRPFSNTALPLSPAVTVNEIKPGSREVPNLLVTPDGYQAVYLDDFPAPHIVSVQTAFDGTVRSVTGGVPSPLFTEVVAAANAGRTLATWRVFELGNKLTYIEAEAALIGSEGLGPIVTVSLADPIQHVVRLLPFGDGVAALWTDSAPNARLVVGRVTGAGLPIDGAGLRLHESEFDQTRASMAGGGGRLLVVWIEGNTSSSYNKQNLYAAAIEPGHALAATVRLLASDAAAGSDPSVVWNGRTFTVVYRRHYALGGDLLALRVDAWADPADATPAVVVPSQSGLANPHLSWNGSEYLLLWQTLYDPNVYIGEPPPCLEPPRIPGELHAQRISDALTPIGAKIDLALATTYSGNFLDTQNFDVGFAGNQWFVLWLDLTVVTCSRIDASGNRISPLNGTRLFYSAFRPAFLARSQDGWSMVFEDLTAGNGIRLAKVADHDGSVTSSVVPWLSMEAIEAFAYSPSPLVACKRGSSPAAFLAVLPQHIRSVRR